MPSPPNSQSPEACRAERRRLVDLRADVSAVLAASQATPLALQQCCEALVRHLDVALARLWTLNEGDSVLELQASAGLYTSLDGPHSRVPTPPIGRGANAREPLCSVLDDPSVSDPEWAAREGLAAFAEYPLVVEDRVIGVLALFAREPLTESVLTELAPLAAGIAQYVDRRQAEERFRRQARELEDREQQFRTLADSIPQLAWMANPDGHIFWYNRRWYDYTGTTLEQMEGWGWQSVHHPDELPKVLERWQASIATGEPFDMVFPLKGKDGVFRPFLTRVVPVRDDQGRVTQWSGTNTDITEARRAEEQLSDQERRTRSVLESITEGFVAVDADWRFTYVNAQAERLYGMPRADVLGRNLWEVFPEALGTVFEREYRRAMTDRVTIRLESPFDRLNVWVVVNVFPIEGGGLSFYFQDISDRKRAEEQLRRSEERFRTLFESIDEGFCVIEMLFDPQGRPVDYRFIEMNPAFSKHTGLQHAEGRTVREMGLDLEPHWFEIYGKVAVTGEPIRFVNEAKALEDRWFDVYAFRLGDPDGRKVALLFNDITARVRAEEQFRASESHRRLALDSAELGAWHVDPATMTLTTDERFRAIFGVTDGRLDYETAVSLIHPDDQGRVREAVAAAIRPDDPQPYALEYRVAQPDGSVRWVFAKGRANVEHVESEPRVASFDGTLADITDRKRGEEQLRESEARLSTALAIARLGAFEWNVLTNAVTLNDRSREIFGFGPGEGTRAEEVFARIDPADLERVLAETQAARRTLYRLETEYRITLPNGSSRTLISISDAVPGAGGQAERFIGVFDDVTERRQAEERLRESEARFRQMADSAPVMIWVTDSSGSCTYLNKQWYDFTGTALEQGLGFGWLDSTHPDDRPEAERLFLAANAEQRPYRMEYRLRRRDGEYRWAIDSATPRLGPGGEFLGYIGSVLDIDERKVLEDDLRQLAADLSEADRRKDEFLATLAHELRNPLAPIRNGLEVMRWSPHDGLAVERARAMMERQLTQMVRLVDDLLDVSRITRDRLELRKERVELAAVVRSAIETSRPLIETSRHDLTVSLPPAPLYLDADLTRLAQVFSNLLNNAAKYTEKAGKIRLIAEPQGDTVVVSIQDNGAGIPAAVLPMVFDLFTQADRTLERSQGGLGIGLTLVKRLVEMHDGAVEARSAGTGQGSEFIVRLPIAAAPSGRATETAETAPAAPPHGARRMLVVDDNLDAAESLVELLEMLGHEVAAAHDGLAAVEAAAAFQPDVILLDIGLPKVNGYEACRLIRELPNGDRIFIVALTGWGQEEDRRRSSEAGFDLHLVKPLDPAALAELVNRRRDTER